MAADYKNTVEYLKEKYRNRFPWIYWLFILMVVVVVALLPVITVEVSSQSRGIVRSAEENIAVKPVVQGRVEKVCMANNKKVSEGDTLLVVSANQIVAQIQTQQRLFVDLDARLHDLRLLCRGNADADSLQTPLYLSDYLDYKERLSELSLKESIILKELRRNEEGAKAGVVTAYDYDQSLADYKSAKVEKEILRQQKMLEWHTEKQEAEQERTNIAGNIERLETEQSDYMLLAPSSGTIVEYSGLSDGAFVYPGETVAYISSDSAMIVECYIAPQDIAYIRKGQKVRLQFDALDYNQWGLGDAEVMDIDNNLTVEQNSSYFIARCELLSDSLSLKNGYAVKIRKGMTLTARFALTRRSLWQLLFDKMDDWFNPKIMQTEQEQ